MGIESVFARDTGKRIMVFDMDGTILDTLQDLTDGVNAAFRKNGLPERTLEDIRRIVGNGIRMTILRAAPEGTEETVLDQAFQDFTEYYRVHCGDHTGPYPGICETLQELKRRGCLLAVVSNKADYAVQQLCLQYFPGLFDAAVGEHDGIRRKPAPDGVLEALQILQQMETEKTPPETEQIQMASGKLQQESETIQPETEKTQMASVKMRMAEEKILYIGDSEVDIRTAANAGLPCVLVDWGFRSREQLAAAGAEVIISSPAELLDMC